MTATLAQVSTIPGKLRRIAVRAFAPSYGQARPAGRPRRLSPGMLRRSEGPVVSAGGGLDGLVARALALVGLVPAER
ncbi:hypothetical protein, partial [Methylobacterium ajmalii]|uniref:hypothetical protein n=1 Tax=Methylobacterium ajmalii TaxID=2738439 RepID=UPI001AEDE231